MKLLFVIALLGTAQMTFAGYITPNISRNNIMPNQSGAAAAMIKRKNISATFSTNTESKDSKDTYNGGGILANYSTDKYSAEVIVIESKSSDNDNQTTSYQDVLFTNIGLEVSNKTYVGGSLQHFKFGTTEANVLGLSASRNFYKDFYAGGQFQSQRYNSIEETSLNSYLVGLGYFRDNISIEVTSYLRPAVEYETRSNKDIETAKVQKNRLEFIQIVDKFQYIIQYQYELDSWDYNTSNAADESDEETNEYSFSVEYLIQQKLAVGFKYSQSEEKYRDELTPTSDKNTKNKGLGMYIRTFISDIQIQADISKDNTEVEYNNGSSDSEVINNSFGLTATYFL